MCDEAVEVKERVVNPEVVVQEATWWEQLAATIIRHSAPFLVCTVLFLMFGNATHQMAELPTLQQGQWQALLIAFGMALVVFRLWTVADYKAFTMKALRQVENYKYACKREQSDRYSDLKRKEEEFERQHLDLIAFFQEFMGDGPHNVTPKVMAGRAIARLQANERYVVGGPSLGGSFISNRDRACLERLRNAACERQKQAEKSQDQWQEKYDRLKESHSEWFGFISDFLYKWVQAIWMSKGQSRGQSVILREIRHDMVLLVYEIWSKNSEIWRFMARIGATDDVRLHQADQDADEDADSQADADEDADSQADDEDDEINIDTSGDGDGDGDD